MWQQEISSHDKHNKIPNPVFFEVMYHDQIRKKPWSLPSYLWNAADSKSVVQGIWHYVIQNGSTLLQKNEAMSFPLRATQNAILWISLDLNINK